VACQCVLVSIRSDRRFEFEADRPTVWRGVTSMDRYTTWWPWLHEFDGTTFETGSRWRCAVKPPLPYVLRFDLVFVEVIEHDSVRVEVEGDLTGRALLQVIDRQGGSELHLAYDLNPANRTLQTVAKVARPAVVVALDWVLDTGARQFGHSALGES
ncbi:MAG TPA: hypothetical protein VMM60_17605, partial [Ilumatobacter sp.]|nr:hypothetical protein [Ilumatobacter sp.]